MTVSCIVCARYSDFLVENREIFIPHLYLAPLQGVTPPEFRDDFWCMVKLEWLDYCMVKKTMTICVVDSAQRSPRSGSTSLRVSWCYPGDTLQCVYELGRHLTNIASLLADHGVEIDSVGHVTIGGPAGVMTGWTVRQNVYGCQRVKTYRGERSIVVDVTRLAGKPYRIECIDCVCVV